jgi:AcrR family transcriptional regulator
VTDRADRPGGAAARERQPRRRQEILDAAVQIFAEKGYRAASMKDIAAEVGLLKGSLYYYVNNKEDFLFEIIKEIYDGALAVLADVKRREAPALERLRALVAGHVHYYASNLGKATVFFREFRSLSEDRQALIIHEGDVYLEYLRDLIREAQSEGAVPPTVDVRIASLGIVGMVNSLYLWYRPGGRMAPHAIARQFAEMAVGSLVGHRA